MIIINKQHNDSLPIPLIKQSCAKILKEKKIDKDVYLHLVTNETIRPLNNKYFKKNKPTNVISFPYDNDKKLLGEIFISIDHCKSETALTGLDLTELIIFYFIHGILHLMGYEHICGGCDAVEMRKEEIRLFNKIYPDILLDDET